jgi:hypothetical protein
MGVETEASTEPAADDAALAGDGDRAPAGEPRASEARLERLIAERDALRSRLTEAEQQLAAVPALREASEELESVHASLSWRATAPLRRAADSTRRELVPRARLAVKRALMRFAPRLRD